MLASVLRQDLCQVQLIPSDEESAPSEIALAQLNPEKANEVVRLQKVELM